MLNKFLALAGLAVFHGGFAEADTQPYITRATPPYTVDIVQYPSTEGAPTEAWEVVTNFADGVYLNYINAPYGDLTADGKPLRICYGKQAGLKFAGISEDSQKLESALELVFFDKTGEQLSTKINCEVFSELVTHHPDDIDIRSFYNSL